MRNPLKLLPADFSVAPLGIMDGLPPLEQTVLVWLWHYNLSGSPRPRVDTLAKHCGVSKTETVRNALQNLIKIGAINVVPTFGEHGTQEANEYIISKTSNRDQQRNSPDSRGGPPPDSGEGYAHVRAHVRVTSLSLSETESTSSLSLSSTKKEDIIQIQREKSAESPKKGTPEKIPFGADSLGFKVKTQADIIIERWNTLAKKHGFPRCLVLNKFRERCVKARMEDFPSATSWEELWAKLETSGKFLKTESWFDFDWVMESTSNFDRVRRGWMDWKYVNKNPSAWAPTKTDADDAHARIKKKQILSDDLPENLESV